MKGSSGDAPLLHQVDKGILCGGKFSTMHITPLQATFMKNFKGLTSLFYAFTKGKGVDIIHKTNSTSRKVIRIANSNQISIIEKEKNWR
jgi:hypothetical protein